VSRPCWCLSTRGKRLCGPRGRHAQSASEGHPRGNTPTGTEGGLERLPKPPRPRADEWSCSRGAMTRARGARRAEHCPIPCRIPNPSDRIEKVTESRECKKRNTTRRPRRRGGGTQSKLLGLGRRNPIHFVLFFRCFRERTSQKQNSRRRLPFIVTSSLRESSI